MALITTFKCDVCAAQRTDVSHWILWDCDDGREVSFLRWTGDRARTHGHLCGAVCAQKKLNEFLEKR
jgi:hypothetical protein